MLRTAFLQAHKSHVTTLTAYVISATVFALPATAEIVQATLGWQPSVHATIAGYEIHIGTSSGSYDEHIDAGMPTLAGEMLRAHVALDDSRDNFIAISAYDGMGTSTAFSDDTLVLAAVVEPEPEPEPEPTPEPEPEPEPDMPPVSDSTMTEVATAAALGLGATVNGEQGADGIPELFRDSRYGGYIKDHIGYGGEYVLCDTRGDGLLDLVVGNLYSDADSARMRRQPGRVLIFDHKSSHDGKGGTKVSKYRARADFMDGMDKFVETHVGCGDIDGDGKDELIVSSGEDGDNRIQVLDDLKHGFDDFALRGSSRGIMRIARDILGVGGNGEMFTAAGDFDGDGLDEISVTFRRPLADQVLILDDADHDLLPMMNPDLDTGYVTTTDAGRATFKGKVAPVTMDVDADGMDELMVIYVSGGDVSFDLFDDESTGFRRID